MTTPIGVQCSLDLTKGQGTGKMCISRLWLESRKSFTKDFVVLVQYPNKFMHGFKFLKISHCFASFFIVMLLLFLLLCFVLYCCAFVLYLMWRQYNTMPCINLSEYWTTLDFVIERLVISRFHCNIQIHVQQIPHRLRDRSYPSGAPKENVDQNHLNVALLNVF